MSQTIRHGGLEFDIDSDALQRAIDAEPDVRTSRPVCLCRPHEPVQMYVALVQGRHVVKRMPNSAYLHHPTCASYEAPEAVSGIADVEGRAILHDDQRATVTLRLAFALSKSPLSHPASLASPVADSAKVPLARLTLRSMIDFLWDAAQLNRWNPKMAGKRNYAVVYKYVRRAAANAFAKRITLSEALYVPEPFHAEEARQIREQAHASLVRCAFQRSGKQPLMLLFGEVKAFTEARQGTVAQVRHAPFLPFYVPAALASRMARIFEAELALWNARPELHLMMLATFAQNAAGMYELAEMALMLTDEGWIPVASLNEVTLFERLAREGRAFMKGLRFNAPADVRLADVLLTDTARATAVYIASGTEPADGREQLERTCEALGLATAFLPAAELASTSLPAARVAVAAPTPASASDRWPPAVVRPPGAQRQVARDPGQ